MARVNEPPAQSDVRLASAAVDREPASPISYGRWARRADRLRGHRDGRKRIPSLAEVNALVESDAPAQLPTPYLEMLLNRARDMMEHERLWFVAATVTARSEQALLESQIAAARAALGPAEAVREKARAELTEADLLARHPAEELRSDVFIRLRREAEREQRIANSEAAYLRLLSAVHGIEAQLARVNETVENRRAIARMRALRISAYFSARTATYWEGLVLAHRDGKHLAPLLPHLTPRLPAWVVPEEPPPPAAAVVVPDEPATNAPPEDAPAEEPLSTSDSFSPEPPVATDPNGGADAIEPQEQHQQQPVPAHRH